MKFRHHLGLGIGFVWAVLIATSFVYSAGRHDALAQVQRLQASAREPGPVVLWKAERAVEVAALTPQCEVHDWGCVTAASIAKR